MQDKTLSSDLEADSEVRDGASVLSLPDDEVRSEFPLSLHFSRGAQLELCFDARADDGGSYCLFLVSYPEEDRKLIAAFAHSSFVEQLVSCFKASDVAALKALISPETAPLNLAALCTIWDQHVNSTASYTEILGAYLEAIEGLEAIPDQYTIIARYSLSPPLDFFLVKDCWARQHFLLLRFSKWEIGRIIVISSSDELESLKAFFEAKNSELSWLYRFSKDVAGVAALITLEFERPKKYFADELKLAAEHLKTRFRDLRVSYLRKREAEAKRFSKLATPPEKSSATAGCAPSALPIHGACERRRSRVTFDHRSTSTPACFFASGAGLLARRMTHNGLVLALWVDPDTSQCGITFSTLGDSIFCSARLKNLKPTEISKLQTEISEGRLGIFLTDSIQRALLAGGGDSHMVEFILAEAKKEKIILSIGMYQLRFCFYRGETESENGYYLELIHLGSFDFFIHCPVLNLSAHALVTCFIYRKTDAIADCLQRGEQNDERTEAFASLLAQLFKKAGRIELSAAIAHYESCLKKPTVNMPP
ncbi:MAG: hypothetical protein COV52_02885 [Gammaproteobacteria bacterium CG11_big_fil_rev_8_21_14_0_20_46_22]|nr:MAG: hypothetical protein COW05_02175 [Gammaproteobacteria bacterium CG12_big_fil_rev_8_21_14_0_65_46_12]PIR11720.1 MAG: hypothetical protein COV52_02885 [Gammaproteobacteria bacterium CG11_big_fil_rev_8_21_14_0_20_46_22]